jgi:hypothetical protein
MKLRLSKALTEAEKGKIIKMMELDQAKAQEKLDLIA